MRLPVPFIQLPLCFDAPRLAAEIAGIDAAAWRPHTHGFRGNDALPLVAVHGDPLNESVAGPMQPTPHLQRMPYMRQALAALGTVLGRTRLMRLSGGAEVTPHVDIDYYWRDRARVHVPIVTQPSVRFHCGTAETHMGVGECWVFDTWRMHRVINDAVDSRVHLVADTVGSQAFWDLVSAGRTPGRADPAWKARRYDFDETLDPRLVTESVNLPKVMSPWELREHFGFLFNETEPSPQLQRLGQATNRFITTWRALWATYGEADEGTEAYRQVLRDYGTEIEQLGAGIRTRNGPLLLRSIQEMVLKAALAGRAQGDPETRETAAASTASTAATAPADPPRANPKRAAVGDPEFDRPVIVVCPPRSGSSLLFETLARAPGVFTIGGESHGLIEGIGALHPAARGFESNRLDATDATPEIIAEVRARFLAAARDRHGRPPAQVPLRLLEKTPKNSLRVPFLARVFPEARFVYLYRDPREVLSSMIEAWQSGRFRTYQDLPGWTGPPWSLVLVPGWRELSGKPLHEVVAAQWSTATRILLDDLAGLPDERRLISRYDALLADPEAEVRRLCYALGFDWDTRLEGKLPLSRHTVSPPNPEKWRRNLREIEAILPGLQPLLDRAVEVAAR